MALRQVFHRGEEAVQDRYGVKQEVASFAGRLVRPFLNEQLRDFFSELPYVVLAGRDTNGQGHVWCTILAKRPQDSSVVAVKDKTHVSLLSAPPVGDPLHSQVAPGSDLGMLGIMLHNRRRNRVNGRVVNAENGALELEVPTFWAIFVVHAFGNCPQYISLREIVPLALADAGEKAVTEGEALPADLAALVGRADTFFIASGYDTRENGGAGSGLDASHRGGSPGFVQVSQDGKCVTYVDVQGNNLYNTMGNLLLDPRVGIAFVDWSSGSLLHITGEAQITFNADATRTVAITVERNHLLTHVGIGVGVGFSINRFVWRPGGLGFAFVEPDPANNSELVLLMTEDEGEDTKSLYFGGVEERPLKPYQAGQHITLQIPNAEVERSYSLSGSPKWALHWRGGPSLYRVTVRKQGVGSRALHKLITGARVNALGNPEGDFVVPPAAKVPGATVVFLGAGVGVTPLVSMMHELLALPEVPEILFVQTARTVDMWPLHKEVGDLIREASQRGVSATYVSSFTRGEPPAASAADTGIRYASGRLTESMLRPLFEADTSVAEKLRREATRNSVYFFVCGPASFMSTAQSLLLDTFGVPDDRLYSETFGPSALKAA
eukprot:scaffold434_cov186-Pinguiococcus_pyrenoidosus.AAC.131